MQSDKLVSVIVPCYNVGKKIERCMEALVNQTIGIDNLEIILVNDASTDNTLDKLTEYGDKYEDSILIVDMPENRRQGGARNAGLLYTTGKYVVYCDADDYIELDMYEVMSRKMKEWDVDCVYCGRTLENEKGERISVELPQKEGVFSLENEDYKNTIRCSLAPGSSVCLRMYKREFLVENDMIFPEKLAYEDNFFCGLEAYYLRRIGIIKKPLYHYICYGDSTSHSKNALHHLDRLKVEIMRVEELKQRGLFERYKEDIEAEFIRFYFVNSVITFMGFLDILPKGIIIEMQQTVKQLFPDWRENIIIKHYSGESFWKVCQLIDYPLERGDKEEVLMVMSRM